MLNTPDPTVHLIWQKFFQSAHLSPRQREQFKQYYDALVRANETHNLTAITDLEKVISDHFEDSLALTRFVDCSRLTMIGDVGTGAGFPAIPIKILFPHLKMVLIEVNNKKRDFLHSVITLLDLQEVEVVDLDWRTFLRKTAYPIDLFCARASLQPEELVRIFKPSSPYQNAQMVYWASEMWKPSQEVSAYVQRDEPYSVGAKNRRLVFFALHT